MILSDMSGQIMRSLVGSKAVWAVETAMTMDLFLVPVPQVFLVKHMMADLAGVFLHTENTHILMGSNVQLMGLHVCGHNVFHAVLICVIH